jgi:hypothetical protein
MPAPLEVEQTDLYSDVCECCGGPRTVVTGFVHSRDGGTLAAYIASLYPAGDKHETEAWIDGILGTWGTDDASDHVTFGAHCRREGCMLVQAAQGDPDPEIESIYGRRLSREEGLAHPWIGAFWDVIDAVLIDDPVVAGFFQHGG